MARLVNIIQKIDEQISGVENKNGRNYGKTESKCNSNKRRRIQVKGPETIFIKIIEENFANLKKMHIKVQGSYSAPNRSKKKTKFPQYIIIISLIHI